MQKFQGRGSNLRVPINLNFPARRRTAQPQLFICQFYYKKYKNQTCKKKSAQTPAQHLRKLHIHSANGSGATVMSSNCAMSFSFFSNDHGLRV